MIKIWLKISYYLNKGIFSGENQGYLYIIKYTKLSAQKKKNSFEFFPFII